MKIYCVNEHCIGNNLLFLQLITRILCIIMHGDIFPVPVCKVAHAGLMDLISES